MDSSDVVEVVRARELWIVNKDNKPVIYLGCTDSGQPYVTLMDANDQCSRISFEVADDRLSMGFLAPDGTTLLGFGCDRINGGGFTIMNAEQSRMAVIKVSENSDNLATFIPK